MVVLAVEYHNPKNEIEVSPRWLEWILFPTFAVIGVLLFAFVLVYCLVVQIHDWMEK